MKWVTGPGKNSTLTTVDLGFSTIGDEGAQALAQALEVNSSLKKLELDGTQVGNQGAQALAEAVRGHPSLTTLSRRALALTLPIHVAGTLTADPIFWLYKFGCTIAFKNVLRVCTVQRMCVYTGGLVRNPLSVPSQVWTRDGKLVGELEADSSFVAMEAGRSSAEFTLGCEDGKVHFFDFLVRG